MWFRFQGMLQCILSLWPSFTGAWNLSGQVVFAPGDGSLWLQNANGANVHVLVKRTGQSYAASPAFSPDGKQVAYALTAYDPNGNAVADIRVINLAGKDERVIAAPPDDKTVFNFPAWSPDGKELWFTRTATSGDVTSDEIDRVSTAGGTAQRVIEGGRAVSVSPDGKKIVFLRLDFTTYRSSLWVADLDGSHARQLLDKDAFAALEGARFSPDSQTLVFAASGAPQEQLPGLQAGRGGTNEVARSQTATADACLARFLFTCWVNTAYAHGLPWDLWMVNLDGTKFERLTEVGADSPYPAWSPDGKFVAFMDLSGFYVVNRETKEGNLISINGGHGALDWR
jgi:Tol biopolymer transport system component